MHCKGTLSIKTGNHIKTQFSMTTQKLSLLYYLAWVLLLERGCLLYKELEAHPGVCELSPSPAVLSRVNYLPAGKRRQKVNS